LRPSRLVLAATAAALLAAARPAEAGTALGLGADWLTVPLAGTLQMTLATDTGLARNLTGGARIGVLIATQGIGPAVPIDARLRWYVKGLYVDGLVGPWIFFGHGSNVRVHGAIGFGIARRGWQLGVEAGYVDPSGIVGARAAWAF